MQVEFCSALRNTRKEFGRDPGAQETEIAASSAPAVQTTAFGMRAPAIDLPFDPLLLSVQRQQ
jgi:hypothetical protein